MLQRKLSSLMLLMLVTLVMLMMVGVERRFYVECWRHCKIPSNPVVAPSPELGFNSAGALLLLPRITSTVVTTLLSQQMVWLSSILIEWSEKEGTSWNHSLDRNQNRRPSVAKSNLAKVGTNQCVRRRTPNKSCHGEHLSKGRVSIWFQWSKSTQSQFLLKAVWAVHVLVGYFFSPAVFQCVACSISCRSELAKAAANRHNIGLRYWVLLVLHQLRLIFNVPSIHGF